MAFGHYFGTTVLQGFLRLEIVFRCLAAAGFCPFSVVRLVSLEKPDQTECRAGEGFSSEAQMAGIFNPVIRLAGLVLLAHSSQTRCGIAHLGFPDHGGQPAGRFPAGAEISRMLVGLDRGRCGVYSHVSESQFAFYSRFVHFIPHSRFLWICGMEAEPLIA